VGNDRQAVPIEFLSEREVALIMEAKVETDAPYSLDDIPAANAGDAVVFSRARELLALVQGDGAATLAELAAALDRLAAAFAEAPAGSFVPDAVSHPITRVDREMIARKFTDFGLYAASNPLNVDGEPLVADAVDDLLDICIQMQEFLALSDTPDEALRQLHGLAGHWMGHLRDLAGYLHARRYSC
jgi:hypothetical protein